MSTRTDARAARPVLRRAAASLAACAALALAGCGGTENTSATLSPSPSTSTTTASATSSPATTTTTGGGTTTPAGTSSCSFSGATTAPGDTALSRMTVTGVRAGAQACFDRVVIDLAGDASKKPGYQVRYVPQVVQDGSGNPIALRGGAFLSVSVGAPAYDSGMQPTYIPANPKEVVNAAGLTSVKQVAWAGSFEGMSTIGIGVSEKVPFAVQILDEGGRVRLVLDIAHKP